MSLLLTVLMMIGPEDYKQIPSGEIKPGLDAVLAVAGDTSDPTVRARIKIGGVLMSPTLKALREVKELLKAEEANQAWNKIIDMCNDGRLLEMKFGTRVRVLKLIDNDTAEIMIRSGPSTGKVAYTGLANFCYVDLAASGKWTSVPFNKINAGYEGLLGHEQADISSPGKVYVYKDTAAFLETVTIASQLKKEEELDILCEAMVIQGKAFAPPAGTKVKVIRVNNNKTLDVQILDGKFESREGVVPAANLCNLSPERGWVPAGDKTKKRPVAGGMKKAHISTVKPGYVGVLGFPGDDPSTPGIVFVAINDTAMSKVLDIAKRSNDENEIKELWLAMVIEGTAFTPARGAKVKVLQVKNGTLDVQILEGNFKSRKGVIVDYNLCTK